MKKIVKKKPTKKKVVKKARKIVEPFVPKLRAPSEYWVGPEIDPTELERKGYKRREVKIELPHWLADKVAQVAREEGAITGKATDPFLNGIKEMFDQCLAIVEKKNVDYSGGSIDHFKNIRNAGFVGVSVERGVLVRMMDKMGRISSLLDREAQVKDESLYDTLNDLINYAAILKLYIKENRTPISITGTLPVK